MKNAAGCIGISVYTMTNFDFQVCLPFFTVKGNSIKQRQNTQTKRTWEGNVPFQEKCSHISHFKEKIIRPGQSIKILQRRRRLILVSLELPSKFKDASKSFPNNHHYPQPTYHFQIQENIAVMYRVIQVLIPSTFYSSHQFHHSNRSI